MTTSHAMYRDLNLDHDMKHFPFTFIDKDDRRYSVLIDW